MKNKIINLFRIFFPLIIGGLIGFLISNNMDYNTLNKPFLSPPSIIFPIVWSILYILIGYSYYYYRKYNNDINLNIVYYIQLILNFIWPILFFSLKLRLFSIFWLITLLITTIILLIQYKKYSKRSFYLTIPYIIWLIFALYLNIGVYILN